MIAENHSLQHSGNSDVFSAPQSMEQASWTQIMTTLTLS